MSLKDKNIFLFDLDGTLVHSAPDLAVAVNTTLIDLGKAPHAETDIMLWVGNGARTLLSRALAGNMHGTEDEALLEGAFPLFMQHYASNISVHSYVYEGVIALLQQLSATNKHIACVTNKPERFTLPLLQKLALADYFSTVVAGDTLPVLKPDPAPLLLACEYMGFTQQQAAEHACMIGDSANDILAAKAAGIMSIGVRYGYAQGRDLLEDGADYLFDNLAELSHAITAECHR